jgi:hypothetical protein
MAGKQLAFTDYELTAAKKRTKREKFMAEMEAVVLWQALIGLIEPTTPRPARMAADLHTCWPQCCGFTCCSSGIPSAIQAWKMP